MGLALQSPLCQPHPCPAGCPHPTPARPADRGQGRCSSPSAPFPSPTSALADCPCRSVCCPRQMIPAAGEPASRNSNPRCGTGGALGGPGRARSLGLQYLPRPHHYPPRSLTLPRAPLRMPDQLRRVRDCALIKDRTSCSCWSPGQALQGARASAHLYGHMDADLASGNGKKLRSWQKAGPRANPHESHML